MIFRKISNIFRKSKISREYKLTPEFQAIGGQNCGMVRGVVASTTMAIGLLCIYVRTIPFLLW